MNRFLIIWNIDALLFARVDVRRRGGGSRRGADDGSCFGVVEQQCCREVEGITMFEKEREGRATLSNVSQALHTIENLREAVNIEKVMNSSSGS
jgi:hypothetical protein